VSVSKRGNVYRVRVYLPNGKQRSKTCQLKSQAKQWEADQMAALATGSFVDPKAGRATFTSYYQDWAKRQVWESNTVRAMNLAARSVPFANLPLGRIGRSNVEQWVKSMVVANLAAGTIKTRCNNVRSVFRAAVRDRLIPHDPSEGGGHPTPTAARGCLAAPDPRADRRADASGRPFIQDVYRTRCVRRPPSWRPQPSRSATSTSSARSWQSYDRSSEPPREASS
jgi:hypothetical protein